jgi:hypothetical protein
MVDYRRKLRARLLVAVFMGHTVLRSQLKHRDRKGVRTFATAPKSPSRQKLPITVTATKPLPMQ